MKNQIKYIKVLITVFILVNLSFALSANQLDPLKNFKHISTHHVKKPIQKNDAGEIKRIFTRYNHDSKKLTWKHTIKINNPKKHGFFLVLSPGEHPKHNNKDYAIFYGDSRTNKVTTYVFNKEKKWNSYESKSLIQTDLLSIKRHGSYITASMTIDTNKINDELGWDSFAFKDRVGIWFKPVYNPKIKYGANGGICNFTSSVMGSYDITNGIANYCNPGTTAPVPEPSTCALLCIGLIALVGYKKKYL